MAASDQVTNAVKRIARLDGIVINHTDPNRPRFSAHSLRRTAIHRALRCDTSALDVRDMTAHKDSLVLATYTTDARAEGAQAKRGSMDTGDKDPWAVHWMFKPVERVVPGAGGEITSTEVAEQRKDESKRREERLAQAQTRVQSLLAAEAEPEASARGDMTVAADAAATAAVSGAIAGAAFATGLGAGL